ncbi:hypothetical protein [Cytobacillus gottheilii]|uniref:hypothetical protein n=1 Tax=Cytobacillus gottheilii TaxID=859144 RepID=UPI0009BA75A3|nr:hypothetical protein [Cytobacillus gottheilii]
MKIYKADGTSVDIADDKIEVIEIKPENIKEIIQSSTGVDILMYDGSAKHFYGAKTDGHSILFD